MVELLINGRKADLSLPEQVKYTRQIGDVLDVSTVANSYTNSFVLPLTPNNTQIMESLGIVGDGSTVPYSRAQAELRVYGVRVALGWLTVSETADGYKVAMIDGMIDYFRVIENKTIGKDLDMSPFNHEKTFETVVDSFDNEFYRYIIADFNGQQMIEDEDGWSINIDYLAPSFSLIKLLQACIEQYGYTLSLDNLDFLDGLWITYPKDPAENVTDELFSTLSKGLYTSTLRQKVGGQWRSTTYYPWTNIDNNEGTMLGNEYVIPEDGVYRFDLAVQAYLEVVNIQAPVFFGLVINGQPAHTIQADSWDVEYTESTSFTMTTGDRVGAILYFPTSYNITQFNTRFHHHHSEVKIYRTNQGEISILDAFTDFKIKDFIKEMMWITGTTPTIDGETIRFLSISERLDISNAQDISDRFVERTRESYTYGNYSQLNGFRHKYNVSGAKYADGYLQVNNENLAEESTLVQSQTFAPENQVYTFRSTDNSQTFNTRKYRIWDVEVRNNSEGDIETSYKGLSDRYYLIRQYNSPSATWRFKSTSVAGSATASVVPYASPVLSTFNQIVENNYADYASLFDNFRMHNIKLALGVLDFVKMDLKRPFYIKQLAGYYIFNRAPFQDGAPSDVEAIRIITPAAIAPPPEPFKVAMMSMDANNIRFSFSTLNGFDELIEEDSFVYFDGDQYPVTSYIAPSGIPVIQFVIETTMPVPMLNSFQIQVTDGTFTQNYIYSSPNVIAPIEGIVVSLPVTIEQV